jgi:hypothetical protein
VLFSLQKTFSFKVAIIIVVFHFGNTKAQKCLVNCSNLGKSYTVESKLQQGLYICVTEQQHDEGKLIY